MKWYVIKSKQSGKYADGFYGWDCTILTEHQIFPEDELPFYIDDERFTFILVADGEDKPSSWDANDIAIAFSKSDTL